MSATKKFYWDYLNDPETIRRQDESESWQQQLNQDEEYQEWLDRKEKEDTEYRHKHEK